MIPDGTVLEKPVGQNDKRRIAFVEAAERAFVEHGYAGTTMSSIAATVGGSKTTLWTYFPSKESLFEAVMDRLIDQYGQVLMTPIGPDLPLRTVLTNSATNILAAILSDPLIALMRLVTGEAGRFPELARIFHDRGHKRGRERMSLYFKAAMARGEMRKGDASRAASQFAAICQSGVYYQTLWGLIDAPTPQAVKADIEATVDSFMRAWAVD